MSPIDPVDALRAAAVHLRRRAGATTPLPAALRRTLKRAAACCEREARHELVRRERVGAP
jgi:adenylosuccinate lyase